MIRKILMACVWALMGVGVSHAEDITIQFNGSTAKVKQQVKDSVNVTVDGAHVKIESAFQAHKLTLLLSGKSDDGQLILKTNGKAKLQLKNLQLTSQEGAPLDLKNKKKVEIVAVDGTENTLTITACNDTANHKASVIYAKDKLKFSGTGTLNVLAKGDGCKGIRSKDDITIEELTLNVETSGNNLGAKANPFGGGMPGFGEGGGFGGPMGGFGRPVGNDSTQRGGFGGPMGGFGGGMPGFDFNNLSDEEKARIEEMRKNFEEMMKNGGGFPNFGGGGFSGFGGGGFPGGEGNGEDEDGEAVPFKQKYNGTCKGIKSLGQIIVNSGKVTVTTASAGAEGIEGKKGVILNGGDVNVTAIDDAINANAAIEFHGANVTAISTTNDAVDANLVDFFGGFGGGPMGGSDNDSTRRTGFGEGGFPDFSGGFQGFGGGGFPGFGGGAQEGGDPAIIITAGTVYAWSKRGAPEEGLDCDFSPIEVSGGKIFSVGAGMGEMPSVPTQESAKQPTALLIGFDIVKDEPVQVCDSKGKVLDTLTVPFSLRRSASIVTTPQFKVGETYTVKTKDYEKTFTLSEQFTIVR